MANLPPEAALIFAEVAARFNELESLRPGLGIQLARRLERIATTSAVGFKNLCSLAAGDGIARQSLDRRAKIVGVSNTLSMPKRVYRV